MSDSAYASLGPTLLARKGGAKPAMRPQLPVLSDPAEVAKLADEQLEDLGWNDMGDDGAVSEDAAAAVVVPIDPANPFDAASAATACASPIVRRQQRRLEERLLADAVMTGPEDAAADEAEEDHADWEAPEAACAPLDAEEPAPAAVLAVRRAPARKPAAGTAGATPARRTAFTLRLDPERHLKLRLAATMRGVSAQVLVTDALDALLAEFDDLSTIAARLQRH